MHNWILDVTIKSDTLKFSTKPKTNRIGPKSKLKLLKSKLQISDHKLSIEIYL